MGNRNSCLMGVIGNSFALKRLNQYPKTRVVSIRKLTLGFQMITVGFQHQNAGLTVSGKNCVMNGMEEVINGKIRAVSSF